MKTDKLLLQKGIKFLSITLVLMFLGPGLIYEAFKNSDHQLYMLVLVIGAIFSIGAIGLGFYSLKLIIDSLFGKKRQV
ncbi:hypothetical protein GTQ40_08065 [Flavobacteriaceae bacterium R38]|nr:hypothetical protein [Flavobacteriaceae bacterium R38]